ncbi:T9SS type A sorting domain-containing protein, partial [Flavobacteriales bacterium]|nr:T9SS type A sorting domain-containing protein [Flavobacteriales bacterium]
FTCEYAMQYYDCNGDCINDTDEDGICNEDEITGCTDPTACNYNDSATDEDSSCEYLNATILQFGDSLKAIYDANLNVSVDWYNIQTNDSTTRYWLMLENSNIFYPSFDCSYFVIAANEFCADTSSIYYYAKEARSIGTMISSPNPTNGKTKIQFDNMKNQFVRLYLINNSGNILEEFLTKNNELEIDLSSYLSGTYHISFNSPKSKGCLNEDTFQKVSNTIILNK